MGKLKKYFQHLKKFHIRAQSIEGISIGFFVLAVLILLTFYFLSQNTLTKTTITLHQTQLQLSKTSQEYIALKNVDQYKKNQLLETEIKNIHASFGNSLSIYDQITDLRAQKQDTSQMDTLYASALEYLSNQNYASANSTLTNISNLIAAANAKIAAASISSVNTNAPQSNTPPSSGFSQQQVTTSNGTFTVDIIAADLNSTRVIVDTASDSDCSNNCPVLPLDAYVSRSGAYAGINGTFFCPQDYPSCAGKVNSFDTLLMNKNKVYFNSANNVYSAVPLVYFSGNTMGVRTTSSQWGRDTSVDSVIAMQPLLIMDGNIVYSGSNDPKYGSKGTRGFIGNKGATVFIGDVLGANMSDSANVLKTLGLDNALNLDEGGSTALWDGGYKLGPGRNLPNAVLFVRK